MGEEKSLETHPDVVFHDRMYSHDPARLNANISELRARRIMTIHGDVEGYSLEMNDDADDWILRDKKGRMLTSFPGETGERDALLEAVRYIRSLKSLKSPDRATSNTAPKKHGSLLDL